MDSRSMFLYSYVCTIIKSIDVDKSQRFEVWNWDEMSNFDKTTVSGDLKNWDISKNTILVDFFVYFPSILGKVSNKKY